MRFIAIFCADLAALNNQFCWKSICIFAMYQNVGSNFTENSIPQTDTGCAFKIKRIRQVLGNKSHDSVITFNQINIDKIAVIVTIQIDFTQNQISSMMGHC